MFISPDEYASVSEYGDDGGDIGDKDEKDKITQVSSLFQLQIKSLFIPQSGDPRLPTVAPTNPFCSMGQPSSQNTSK